MDLRQLRYFLTVVEEANFTRAAERLHLAQPGISAQIRRLERELGQQLLERSGRGVRVTEAGAAVLPYARAALEAAEGVRQTAGEFAGLLRGRVRVGVVSGVAAVSGTAAEGLDVAGVLADFHDAHPRVDIHLTENTSERMLAALRDGELDLALLGLADEEPPPGTAAVCVLDHPLAAAVSPDDPLAAVAPRPVPLDALRERSLICLPHGTGIRGALERACAAAGFRPRVAFEAAAPPLLARLAARGLGVAVLPDVPAETAGALGLRTVPLDAPRLRGRISLTWRTGGPSGPAARALLARMCAAFPPAHPVGRGSFS
ncbi:LysR family transcriptional regulator [Streptomyces sp. NHF165]|uniref:LysR family transcriptional regulator n=1 Tax=Streptomyces sp. NHF165 TaxID=2175864 RepID=UPI00132EFBFF|nr:LysR substrate-binding domain-containing protein [Streptomyces sp. NHF165]QHF93009.1 LysR family transcriptional regulator [Streptomyces sp. NHF165]